MSSIALPKFRVEIHFDIPHHFLPILPPKEEFLQDLRWQSPLLLNSIFALASTYASFPIPHDYRAIALGQLEAMTLSSSPPSPSAQSVSTLADAMEPLSFEAVQYMSAMLILVYVEFGRACIPSACELMSRACAFAQKMGWNVLDTTPNPHPPLVGQPSEAWGHNQVLRPPPRSSTLSSASSSPVSSPASSMLPGMGPMSETQTKERIRVLWWECWATDVVMSITCRQPRNAHNVALNINLPAPLALYREPSCPIVWVSEHHLSRFSLLTFFFFLTG